MENFTPLSALGGGLLIGLSAAILLIVNGRIAGISGILDGTMRPKAGQFAWRAAFVLGLLASAPLLWLAGYTLPAVTVDATLPVLVAAGLLVGFGTRLGSGCTSGHGVCGIGRGSGRSLAATATFMVTAIATVFLFNTLLGG